MSFLESPRFPERISIGAVVGPAFSTDVLVLRSGDESRNANWANARARFDVTQGGKTEAENKALVEFFRRVKGRAYGFRFKDWSDYQVTTAEGGLRGLHGTVQAGGFQSGYGVPSYQLQRRYGSGGYLEDRDIRKPVSGTVAVRRAGVAVTVGAGAGQIAIDTTTGVVTFVADQTRSVSSHTVGASHVVTLASAFSPNVAVGGRIYLTGVTGTAAALLNDRSHAVTNVATNVITIGTTTTGLTATGGTAALYPQPAQALDWSGEFDVPVRFDSDEARITVIDRSPVGLMYSWEGIGIVEIRV